jgi:hypothetical protein
MGRAHQDGDGGIEHRSRNYRVVQRRRNDRSNNMVGHELPVRAGAGKHNVERNGVHLRIGKILRLLELTDEDWQHKGSVGASTICQSRIVHRGAPTSRELSYESQTIRIDINQEFAAM